MTDDVCIVIQDDNGDRHADDFDGGDARAAAIALAREVGCEAGEPITYWTVASDDPGAARLLPSSASIGSHNTLDLPPLCESCGDTGSYEVDAWDHRSGHYTRPEFCSCDAGRDRRDADEEARAEARWSDD